MVNLFVNMDGAWQAFTEGARGYVAEAVGGRYKQSFFELVAAGVVTPAQWRRER